MSPDSVYRQAAKEARWALGLTLFYVVAWCVTAYFTPDAAGMFGFPLWFELSCLFLPLIFTLLVAAMVRYGFKDIDLNTETLNAEATHTKTAHTQTTGDRRDEAKP